MNRCWWGLPRTIVAEFIKNCSCQVNKVSKYAPLLNPIISNQFMERLQMDLIDMRSAPNDLDMNFIFHAMDHFTKIHFILPIKRKTAQCVADCLCNHVFPVYGLPRILQMDNGK